MLNRMSPVLLALAAAGCADPEVEERDLAAEEARELAEARGALSFAPYSASGTHSAELGDKVAKIDVKIGAGATVMIGTDGITGSQHRGNTFLRLFEPTGGEIASNDDWACDGSRGSRIGVQSLYDGAKSFELWGGCFEDEECGTNIVAVARLRATYSFDTGGTHSAMNRGRTMNRDFHFDDGITVRASTCENVAFRAAHLGNTYLRLFWKDGSKLVEVAENNDTPICSSQCDGGSAILYKIPIAGLYELRAGCFADEPCRGTVAVYEE